MPSTPFPSPQVVSRTFASFRVVNIRVSAGQRDFCTGFDSRQLHQEIAGQSPKKAQLSRYVKIYVKIWMFWLFVASIRTRQGGSTYVQVLYRLNGKQSSSSFEDLASATKFQKLVEKFGPREGARDPRYRPRVLGHDGPHVVGACSPQLRLSGGQATP
jgi:hypothetical protein